MAKKMTRAEIKKLITLGAAKDISKATSRTAIKESYALIGYCRDVNGNRNASLYKGSSGKLYAIVGNCNAHYIFG